MRAGFWSQNLFVWLQNSTRLKLHNCQSSITASDAAVLNAIPVYGIRGGIKGIEGFKATFGRQLGTNNFGFDEKNDSKVRCE